MLDKDAVVCGQGVIGLGSMEGPMLLIEAPCMVCDKVTFIETCVIVTTSKVQEKAVLFCVPFLRMLKGASCGSNPFCGPI